MPEIELSIVMPCLNEAGTVAHCIDQAAAYLRTSQISGEIILADNGSTDGSADVAQERGARVMNVDEKGYGSALRGGFAAARGRYVIMGDADRSYDFLHLDPFIERLRQGYDLVMGNRFAGGIARGAMPWHHKYIGNPVLSFIGRLFFRIPVHDFHCGLRGLRRASIERMALHTTGMELASEIIVKAALLGMRVCEVPTTLSPGRGDRLPHLHSFRDGWRHLRFLLIYSPRWLFLYPGLFFVLVGGIFSLLLFCGRVDIGVRRLDFHSFLYAGALMLTGLNMLSFAVITRVYAQQRNLLPVQAGLQKALQFVNLERGLIVGGVLTLLGFALGLWSLHVSRTAGFSAIGFARSVRLVYGSSLAIIAGAQVILTSFVLSILGLKTK